MKQAPRPSTRFGFPICWRARPHAVSLSLCVLALASCGSGPSETEEPFVAVLAAFPAELAALVERARVEETIRTAERTLRVGRLGGVRVVLAMTGIGLLNAERTTRDVLDRFDVTGVVVSGVAGAPSRIGDVVVPESWALASGARFDATPEWIDLARQLARAHPTFDRCTVVAASGESVCLSHVPTIVIGGTGSSDDSFGDSPLPCQPGGDDVFGCDVVESIATGTETDGEPSAVDMETAAIAAEAEARGLPFIAFRAVSDGEGDPLGLPGFPAQFFAYYRLASANAAIATTEFLTQLR